MEECPHFSVTPLSETHSALLDSHGGCVAKLPGIVLEKAFSLNDGRLLVVTTDNCPFEEGFHLSLIDSDGSLLESAHRVIPYHPGILAKLFSVGEETIKIVFHDGEAIKVTVVSVASRRPAGYLQEQFRSGNGLLGKHYLKITSVPGEGSSDSKTASNETKGETSQPC
ncbi:hypothetical protein [Marinobacter sp. LN3S78]|uniref:hypothetical protein n=1 Tax=Marinobacter sp. LN3S78 TaxID=3382300 RepID=UPI00387AA834